MIVRLPVEVVVPLRWDGGDDATHSRNLEEMTAYLTTLSRHADVTVVDGSRPERFGEHRDAWQSLVRHVAPGPLPGINGKVVGAMTGVHLARHELVILADDDVRYDLATLVDVVVLLGDADLVRPQNVFSSWPWHARWDGARSLLNRAVAADWPGTFGVRRSALRRTSGWDADVLFENLELVRTLRAAGARVVDAPQVLVPRQPPTARHFWSQRVRQAYDDVAQPWRLTAALATVPGAVFLAVRRPTALLGVAVALVGLAESGRQRAGAARLVPADVPLWAPAWVLERGVCSWVALGALARGGVRYHGRRLRTAAHSPRALRRRLAQLPEAEELAVRA
ncbi:MAG TPA: glycosyltransferase family 2 protein [Actinomycetales bacterium]|nr:glycosyltransferase family 2 protein [Actinomycetales bacterium]